MQDPKGCYYLQAPMVLQTSQFCNPWQFCVPTLREKKENVLRVIETLNKINKLKVRHWVSNIIVLALISALILTLAAMQRVFFPHGKRRKDHEKFCPRTADMLFFHMQ